MKLYDNDSYREEFMNGVYALLSSDPTSDRANQIIDMFDLAPAVDATVERPNDPLTLEELREMDGESVWCADVERWGILESDEIGFVVTFDHLTWCIEVEKLTLYRRRPGDGTEATPTEGRAET